MSALLSLRKALRSGRVATVFPPLRVEGLTVEMNLGSAQKPNWTSLPEEMAVDLCEQLHLEEKAGPLPPPLSNKLSSTVTKAGGPVVRIDTAELAEALAEVLIPLLTRKVTRTVERDNNGLITRIIETTE
jgi:hypothetical protein